MAHQTQQNQADISWMIPVKLMLGSLDHGQVQACSISSVPDELRKTNEEAYRPKVVCLGPLHRGTRSQLVPMEELKWRYMLDFLGRKGSQEETRGLESESEPEVRLEDCGIEILNLDKVIRASYGGNIDLERYELAKLMLVDGCFLLELLLKLGTYMNDEQNQLQDTHSQDPILESEEKVLSVLNDTILLENQIPFIVLKRLYRKVFRVRNIGIENDHRVADIVLNALGYPLVHTSGVAHLLHLIHLSTTTKQEGKHETRQACQELKRCATRLRAAGITIRPTNSSNLGDMPQRRKLVDSFDFGIIFRGRFLDIPPLHIKETTEIKWRNLIAWEQSRIRIRYKYTSYALFFQGLICCVHDIELLEKNGVIVNESKKSNEDLLTLFRTMSKGTDHMDSSYREVCDNLNNYRGEKVIISSQVLPIITWHQCRRMFEIIMYYWQNWYDILIRDHIPTVWKLIGVLAAVLLLVLTILQTYYAANSNN